MHAREHHTLHLATKKRYPFARGNPSTTSSTLSSSSNETVANIFESGNIAEEKKARNVNNNDKPSRAQPGSKHYKLELLVAKSDGIAKKREVLSGEYGMKKMERAGLKNHYGMPKKNGVKLGDYPSSSSDYDAVLDINDPNYDSEDETDPGITLVSSMAKQVELAKRTGVPVDSVITSRKVNAKPAWDIAHLSKRNMPLNEYRKHILAILEEYLVSEESEDFIMSVLELDSPVWNYELVRKAITVAMERNVRERELISRLLVLLSQRHIVSPEQFGKAFERLFETVDDLVLDIPSAKDMIARFLARAVNDEVLPPSYLLDPLVVALGHEIVHEAKGFLSMKHGFTKLQHIWGETGEILPVDALKQEITLIVQEYLISSDVDEAATCIKVLNVPHFHHELVKRAVVISMDHTDRERGMISTLFAELFSRDLLTKHQLIDGYRRCVEALPDLILDTPNAEQVLKVYIMQSVADGNISALEGSKLFP